MRVAKIDDYLELDQIDDPVERESIHSRFPHVVLVEGDFPEFDVAVRWCWHRFGPQDGECWFHSEYPACPIVLATEYTEQREFRSIRYEIKAYKRVERHTHTGDWAIHWLGKTDYDYGFGEFCFASESQKDEFEQVVPEIDWGENYPSSKGQVE